MTYAEQLTLPLEWYATHDHGGGPHQHFPDDSIEVDHVGVALVAYDPTAGDDEDEDDDEDELDDDDEDDDSENDLDDTIRLELKAVQATNHDLYHELLSKQVHPDCPDGRYQTSVVLLRLSVLMDEVLSPAARLKVDLAFEVGMTDLLSQCLGDLARAQLLGAVAPVSPSPGSLFVLPGGAR